MSEKPPTKNTSKKSPREGLITPLLEIMAALRNPKTGCPWDIEQNFASIARYTIEEAYEVVDAIHSGDRDNLRDELGDLLLQVVFHAQMADEENSFNFADVVDAVCKKMIRRHPHVFGDDHSINSADAQIENWELVKAAERAEKAARNHGKTSNDDAENSSVLADIPHALPALMRAQKLGKRASATGFDWPDISGVVEKIEEELDEVLHAASGGDEAAITEEIGDLLFAVTNLARHLNVDAEEALRTANHKFTSRFQHVETHTRQEGKDLQKLDIQALEEYWRKAKIAERKAK
jgi:ATP diphosphatase